MDVPRGDNALFKESVYELHKRESRFFTTGITSSGSRSIATRCWKARCGSGYERLSGSCAKNLASRSSLAFCLENVSICSWKSRPILRSATSCGASRDAHRIRCRWSSQTCASATGGGISGLGATSPPPAATSRTMSYFSIFRSTNLPAPAGSYSVVDSAATTRAYALAKLTESNEFEQIARHHTEFLHGRARKRRSGSDPGRTCARRDAALCGAWSVAHIYDRTRTRVNGRPATLPRGAYKCEALHRAHAQSPCRPCKPGTQPVAARVILAQMLWLQGFPDQAMRTAQTALRRLDQRAMRSRCATRWRKRSARSRC